MELLVLHAELAAEHRLTLATVTGDVDLATDNGRVHSHVIKAPRWASQGGASARAPGRRRAMVQLATREAGRRPWWPQRPFGYDADPRPGHRQWWTSKGDPPVTTSLHATEADLIRQAYTECARRHLALRAIARRWNEAGVTTPQGNEWIGTAGPATCCWRRATRGCASTAVRWWARAPGPPSSTRTPGAHAVALLSDPARNKKGIGRGRKYLLSGPRDLRAVRRPDVVGLLAPQRPPELPVLPGGLPEDRPGRRTKLDELVTETVVRRLSAPDAVQLLVTDEDEVDVPALHERRRAVAGRGWSSWAWSSPMGTYRRPRCGRPRRASRRSWPRSRTRYRRPGQARVFEGVIGAKDVRAAFDGLDLDRQARHRGRADDDHGAAGRPGHRAGVRPAVHRRGVEARRWVGRCAAR